MHWRCKWAVCLYLAACLLTTAPARAGEDCNDDGIPDDRHGLGLLFFDRFDWVVLDSSRWDKTDSAEADDAGMNEPSGPYSLRLNGNCYGGDVVETIEIDLTNAERATLSYYWQRTGGGDSPESGDDLFVEYRDEFGEWRLLRQYYGAGGDMTDFVEETVTLPAAARHPAFRLRFRNIATYGRFDDWFIDDVYIVDLVPDCNGNGTPDDCDIDEGFSSDCNGNGIPDECDIAAGVSKDCNGNLTPDECDAASGYSDDLNGDFIPDECQDCNGNMTLDPYDIAFGASMDCDSNGVPDECDITEGIHEDCDGNGVPDVCDMAARCYYSDDGVFETKVGSAIGGGIIWLNQFVVEAGGEDATAIEIAWGHVESGTAASLAIWTDPDNDGEPSNAELIYRVDNVLVQNPETNRYARIEIPRLRLGAAGEVFYVGAYMPAAPSAYPAALDSSSVSMERSWVVFGDNLVDLEDNAYPPALIDSYGSPGNFLLRCASAGRDCNDNGVFDVCDVVELEVYDNNLDYVPDECQLGQFVSLELIPDASCYSTGDMVTVEVWMNDAADVVVGGQFFLDYDASRLTLLAAEPAAAPFMFTQQVYECTMNEGGGDVCEPIEGVIDYAVGVDPQAGGASGESMMAVLSFQALQPICDSDSLLDWRRDDVVRLGDENDNPLYPLLAPIDLGDFTRPMLTVAPDIRLEVDAAGLCWASAAITPPEADDECTSAEDLIITWLRDDGVQTLEAPFDVTNSPVTISWQAEDECGNVAYDSTVVNVALLGDLDYDYDVDLSDLAELLAHYGTASGAAYEDGDLDHDGDVKLADLAALLSMYGANCQ